MRNRTAVNGTPTRTPWSWAAQTPLRAFIRTETGSATLVLTLTVVALVWVAVSPTTYERMWTTRLAVELGSVQLGQDLRGWVNSGLMTFFFLVLGLEARRSLDIGDLRQRSRALLPVIAGLGGMASSVGIYLALNRSGVGAAGWGIAMSTDTAFALGLLALARARPLGPLRAFMLTVLVVDDVVALVVIATFYSGHVAVVPLLIGLAVFGLAVIAVRFRIRRGWLYLGLGVVIWTCLYISGLDPLIVGLAMGLLTYAAPGVRDDLERATSEFRLFREQPTSELARSARQRVRLALSPNELLQGLYHPWTSYAIVPLFALANAGIAIDFAALSQAAHSPISVGIVIAYVVGKPLGIGISSLAVRLVSRGRLRPPVGWVALLGGGASAGVGFTVSLLIATLAFSGPDLEAAKLGVLAAAAGSALITGAIFAAVRLLPAGVRTRALLGKLPALADLAEPVDVHRDHLRGATDAPLTLLEYGDLECPYCGRAEPAVRRLLETSEDVRYVWRHLPLVDVHPHAQMAAEATEAAAHQGKFWEMHDLLLAHPEALEPLDLLGYASKLDLDLGRFRADLLRHTFTDRIAEDVASAAASNVLGTPTFFVNGRRHHGTYDEQALLAAVQEARAQLTRTPDGRSDGVAARA